LGENLRNSGEKYEAEGRARKSARPGIVVAIIESQIETGTPYLLYKDACNSKSNQQNLGTIKVQPLHGNSGVHFSDELRCVILRLLLAAICDKWKI
jgi:hypothetical protein